VPTATGASFVNALSFPAPPILAATTDGQRFPVRRLFCIGRNYAAHAREMGMDPDREPPFYFTKWAETVVASGSTIAHPPLTRNFHYEVELVVAIGKAGHRVAPDDARGHVYGYATGLDRLQIPDFRPGAGAGNPDGPA
jgi:fumarylpyruvate hydrolase